MAKMPKTPSGKTLGRPPSPPDPNKAVLAPPRMRPTSTRNYGKGGTPLSGAPNMGLMGAGIGFGGPKNGV